jgi:cytochrome c-type biogenesis protein CcmE
MTTRKKKRMSLIGLGMLAMAGAAALSLSAFEDNIVFFYSPSDLTTEEVPQDRRFRLGGLVEEGSVQKVEDGATITFDVTDGAEAVSVRYRGLLPDLFREGQGVVAHGTLNERGVFVADEVLAKHDENYMPPEVADALKRAGTWKHGEQQAQGGGAAAAAEPDPSYATQ